MNNVSHFKLPKPYPERLKEGRIARGLSADELAKSVGVTRAAISQFEQAKASPSAETFSAIIKVLDLPLSFFITPPENYNQSTHGATFFRSMKSAEKKAREMVRVRAGWVHTHICSYLEQYLDFPEVTFSNFVSGIDCENLDDEEIEAIASSLRALWGLGLGPISDLTLLLEKQGIIISKVNFGNAQVDACSQWRGNRPFIFLGAEKSAVRSRFDLAHELGHLVLHAWITNEQLEDKDILKTIEQQADKFASCFLLPRETFLSELTSISMDHFIYLKKRWKVSIAAMVHRCHDLGVITDNQNRYLQSQLSIKQWRKKEPLDDVISHEVPIAFQQAINMLVEHRVSTVNAIVEAMKFNPNEIEDYCSLPKGTLTPKEDPKVIPFQLRNSQINN